MECIVGFSGGPTCIGPTSNEYCTPLVGHCDAPILANIKQQTLEYRDTFWIMAHFSRFIPRGSVRVGIANDTKTGLVFTAAVTPKTSYRCGAQRSRQHPEHYQIKSVINMCIFLSFIRTVFNYLV